METTGGPRHVLTGRDSRLCRSCPVGWGGAILYAPVYRFKSSPRLPPESRPTARLPPHDHEDVREDGWLSGGIAKACSDPESLSGFPLPDLLLNRRQIRLDLRQRVSHRPGWRQHRAGARAGTDERIRERRKPLTNGLHGHLP